MLFQMALVLAVIGTITEILIVHNIKYVDKLYTQGSHLFWIKSWHVKGMIWNTIGSFVLSWAQGKMFGAEGLVIACGGAFSTAMSQVYFLAEKYVQDTYGHETIYKFISAQGDEIKKTVADGLQLARDVWKVVKFCLKVITFPVWGTRAAIRGWNSFKSQYLSLPTTKGASG